MNFRSLQSPKLYASPSSSDAVALKARKKIYALVDRHLFNDRQLSSGLREVKTYSSLSRLDNVDGLDILAGTGKMLLRYSRK